MRDFIFRFVSDESGATAIEYGLIVGGIALVIVAAMNGIASTMNENYFEIIADAL